jgi:hypothetical protein
LVERDAGYSNNLLVELYRLAHRQQENFTTDAFVHLVRYLWQQERAAAVELLDWLTDSTLFSARKNVAALWIRTRAATDEHGIPDIRIETDDMYVIIEVKLGAVLTLEQVEAYEKEVKGDPREHRGLVALTGWPPQNPLKGELAERSWDDITLVVRLWGEVGDKLEGSVRDMNSDVAQHLTEQLIGLLTDLGLMPGRVRSRLSSEMREHEEWAKAHRDQPSLTRSRVKSIERLADMEHTDSLRALLSQMQHVLSHAAGVDTYVVDSGYNGPEPWIGFNINGLRYFFYVSRKQPEHVILQRYAAVDPNAFDGSLGELEVGPPSKPVRWRCLLDLVEHDGGRYFKVEKAEQLKIIREFFECTFSFAAGLAASAGAISDKSIAGWEG